MMQWPMKNRMLSKIIEIDESLFLKLKKEKKNTGIILL